MKTKFSKRILSLFLAVLMISTAIPFVSLSANAADTASSTEKTHYLMSYFKDDTTNGQAVRFAVSEDGVNFTPLNNNNQVINQTLGRLACRDPYLFYGQDGYYYIVATDMDCNISKGSIWGDWWNNSNSIIFWRSKDLVNWTDETVISIASMFSDNWVGRAWAPQVIWDANHANGDGTTGAYMVYLGVAHNGIPDADTYNSDYHTDMTYFYTTDLLDVNKYESPKALFSEPITVANRHRIDGDIYYDGSQYIMYYSDYGDDASTIDVNYTDKTYYATSANINGPYVSELDDAHLVYSKRMEGFTTYTLSDGTLMAFGDCNNDNDKTTNLFKFTAGPLSKVEPVADLGNIDGQGSRVRHGSIISITQKEYDYLRINDFAFRMADSDTIWQNAGQAYSAYLTAKQYFDSYYYGENSAEMSDSTVITNTTAVTRAQLDEKISALQSALNNMTAISPATVQQGPAGSAQGIGFSGDYNNGVRKDDAPDNYDPAYYYKNLLYSPLVTASTASTGELTLSSAWNGSTKATFTLYHAETVAIYDSNLICMPVLLNSYSTRTGTWSGKHKIFGVYPTSSELFMNENWFGNRTDDAINFIWPISSTNDRLGFSDSNLTDGVEKTRGNNYKFSNRLIVNNSISFGSEYSKDITPSWKFAVGIDITTKDSPYIATATSSNHIYVIDYAGIAKDFSIKNLDSYDINSSNVSSLISYMDSNASQLDPSATSVSYSSGVSAAVSSYNTQAKSITSTVKNYSLVSSNAYDLLRTAIENSPLKVNDNCYANWQAYIDARKTAINAINTVASANTYATTYDSKTIENIANALNTARAALVPEGEHKYQYNTEANNLATFKCTVKPDVHSSVNNVDVQNYNTLAMIYDTLDTAVFTESGMTAVNNAKAVFDAMKTTVTANPQTLIDNCVSTLLNAINSNTTDTNIKNQYKVTFKVSLNGTETAVFTEKDYNYGSVAALDASDYVGGATCTNWKIEAGGTTKNAAYESNQYSVLVQSDTVVTAYCTTNSDVVIITDQYGATLYSIPATAGQSITVSGNTVTVNGVPYTVPNMPYLAITGFTVNGIETNSAEVASGTTTIKPISAYSTDALYNIKLDNSTVESDVKYDDRITVTSDNADAYALAIKVGNDYSIAAYGTTYEFYANRDMEFFTVTGSNGNYSINGTTVTDALMIHNLDYKLPFVYSAAACTDESAKKFTTFSAYTTAVPEGVKVVEVGTLYTKDASADLVIGSENVYASVNKYHIDFSNQYSLSIKNGVGNGVRTRAYVKYNYKLASGETIEAVSYGNICSL
ncbi:MAG: hypothetical protein ACI4IR_00375 [Eubacterium sp.]